VADRCTFCLARSAPEGRATRYGYPERDLCHDRPLGALYRFDVGSDLASLPALTLSHLLVRDSATEDLVQCALLVGIRVGRRIRLGDNNALLPARCLRLGCGSS
jgi:hypothetical protein